MVPCESHPPLSKIFHRAVAREDYNEFIVIEPIAKRSRLFYMEPVYSAFYLLGIIITWRNARDDGECKKEDGGG